MILEGYGREWRWLRYNTQQCDQRAACWLVEANKPADILREYGKHAKVEAKIRQSDADRMLISGGKMIWLTSGVHTASMRQGWLRCVKVVCGPHAD